MPMQFLVYTRKMMSEKSELGKPSLESSTSDVLLREAKALGDPTRYRIFRYIDVAGRPVYIDELTALLRVNHNAVRQHLAVLKGAHLVSEQLENRSKPGRPRLKYTLDPQVRGSWGTKGPYQAVAILLAEAMKSKRPVRDVGRDAGRSRVQGSNGQGHDLLTVLSDNLTEEGFDPKVVGTDDGFDVVLQQCPFVEVASVDPSTVCEIHLGLLEGLVHELDPQLDLSLSVRDPRRAGCRVKVRGIHDQLGCRAAPLAPDRS